MCLLDRNVPTFIFLFLHFFSNMEVCTFCTVAHKNWEIKRKSFDYAADRTNKEEKREKKNWNEDRRWELSQQMECNWKSIFELNGLRCKISDWRHLHPLLVSNTQSGNNNDRIFFKPNKLHSALMQRYSYLTINYKRVYQDPDQSISNSNHRPKHTMCAIKYKNKHRTHHD